MLDNLKRKWQSLVEIWNRPKPSGDHKRAWAEYEKVLMVRSNIGAASYSLYTVMAYATGTVDSDKSREYIESGGQHSEAFVESSFELLQVLLAVAFFLRFIILPLSYKKLNLTKFYLYIQLCVTTVKYLFPNDYGTEQMTLMRVQNFMNFVAFSFDFWPSVIGIML